METFKKKTSDAGETTKVEVSKLQDKNSTLTSEKKRVVEELADTKLILENKTNEYNQKTVEITKTIMIHETTIRNITGNN